MLQATEIAEIRYQHLLARFRIMEVERDTLMSRIIELEASQSNPAVQVGSTYTGVCTAVEFIAQNDGPCVRLQEVGP